VASRREHRGRQKRPSRGQRRQRRDAHLRVPEPEIVLPFRIVEPETVVAHVGPTNSGKTHAALEFLAEHLGASRGLCLGMEADGGRLVTVAAHGAPASSLIDDLVAAGIDVPKDKEHPERGDLAVMRSGDIIEACGQMADAMKAKGIPVTYVLFPDEGHGFARPVNNIAFNAVAENFLQTCLGGRSEPIGEGLKGSSIQVLQGADIVNGLQQSLASK